MREGDLVRIRPSARLAKPWSVYASRGTAMRVRRIDRSRRRGEFDIEPADMSTSGFRHCWFGEDQLEVWDPSQSSRGDSIRDWLMERAGERLSRTDDGDSR